MPRSSLRACNCDFKIDRISNSLLARAHICIYIYIYICACRYVRAAAWWRRHTTVGRAPGHAWAGDHRYRPAGIYLEECTGQYLDIHTSRQMYACGRPEAWAGRARETYRLLTRRWVTVGILDELQITFLSLDREKSLNKIFWILES